MKQDIGELFKVATERTPEAQLISTIKEDLITALQDFNIQVPENLEVSFTEAKDKVVLSSKWEHLDPLYTALAHQCAETVLKQEAQARSFPSMLRSFAPKKHSKLAEAAFYIINALLLLGSLGWVFSAISSPDFSEWFISEVVRGGEVLVTFGFMFLLPALLLTTTLGYFISSHTKRPGVTLSEVVRSFEVPALLFLWISQLFILYAPLTSGLRLYLAGLLAFLLFGWFAWVFRMGVSSFKGAVFHHVVLSTGTVVILYAFLVFVVPVLAVIVANIEIVDFFSEMMKVLMFNPLYLLVVAFDLLIGGVIVAVPFIILWRRIRVLRLSIGRLDAEHNRLGRKITLAVGLIFVTGLFLCSWTPSLGHYGESLILLAQTESASYEQLAARATVLVGEKEIVDELLERELNYGRQHLFDRKDIERSFKKGGSLFGVYVSVVWFPFIDWEERSSRDSIDAYKKGYELAYGVPYGYSTDPTVASRQVQHLTRDIMVNTETSDMIAQVTITDSFSTFMDRDQEVVFEFSLPEEAVVTDLRLGPALQYQGQIAPRGAAEQTYVEQVRRRVDPALLEQVGPRQYRLRVYPVPAASEGAERQRREEVAGEVQRVQFTYYVLRDTAGIPLPEYSATRNVLSNETEYTVQLNGQVRQMSEDLRYVVDARPIAELCAADEVFKLSVSDIGQAEVLVGRSSLSTDCSSTGLAVEVVRGKKVQFMVDTSYENRDGRLESALQQLRGLPASFFLNNTVTLTLFNSVAKEAKTIARPEDVPQASDLVFFGRSTLPILANAIAANTETVIILSGVRNTFAEDSELPSQRFYNKTISIVHEGAIPTNGPNIESSLRKIKSLTVHSDFNEALAVALAHLDRPSQGDVMIGDYWSIMTDSPRSVYPYSTSTSVSVGSSTGSLSPAWSGLEDYVPEYRYANNSAEKMVEKLALRADIKRQLKNAMSPVQLHAYATTAGIVTPLSSYIALVNEEQQARLDKLSVGETSFTSEQRFQVTQPRVANPLFRSPLSTGSGSMFLNDARDGGQDASVKQSIGNARSQAELEYNQNGNSYEGVCESQAIQKLMGAARDNRSETTDVVTSDTVASGLNTVTCHDSATGYAIIAPLNVPKEDRVQSWCVDSTGFAGVMDPGALDGSGTDVQCADDKFVDPELVKVVPVEKPFIDRLGGVVPVLVFGALLLLLVGLSWWLLRYMKRYASKAEDVQTPPLP